MHAVGKASDGNRSEALRASLSKQPPASLAEVHPQPVFEVRYGPRRPRGGKTKRARADEGSSQGGSDIKPVPLVDEGSLSGSTTSVERGSSQSSLASSQPSPVPVLEIATVGPLLEDVYKGFCSVSTCAPVASYSRKLHGASERVYT